MGYDTWPPDAYKLAGGANAWAGVTVDVKNGLVFAATGSASFDFYGVTRHGNDLFADCVLALDARTGKYVWHFQGIRHDVWDWDFPAAPNLVTVRRDGRAVEAVAQITKYGYTYVLDRHTGAPLFPVQMRKVPASTIDGEEVATEQPYPTLPVAVRAPGADRGHAHDAHAGGARGRARAIQEVSEGLFHAAVARGHDRVSGIRRRRGVGRGRVRSRHGAALRQLQRDAVDHQADPEQRHGALQQQVRDVSSRRSEGRRDRAVTDRRRHAAVARRNRDDHPAGHRPDARVPRHGRAQHQRRRRIS